MGKNGTNKERGIDVDYEDYEDEDEDEDKEVSNCFMFLRDKLEEAVDLLEDKQVSSCCFLLGRLHNICSNMDKLIKEEIDSYKSPKSPEHTAGKVCF